MCATWVKSGFKRQSGRVRLQSVDAPCPVLPSQSGLFKCVGRLPADGLHRDAPHNLEIARAGVRGWLPCVDAPSPPTVSGTIGLTLGKLRLPQDAPAWRLASDARAIAFQLGNLFPVGGSASYMGGTYSKPTLSNNVLLSDGMRAKSLDKSTIGEVNIRGSNGCEWVHVPSKCWHRKWKKKKSSHDGDALRAL